MKLISVIVPVFNEEENVEPLYAAVGAVAERLKDRYAWEFVFTDNCSTDRTFERLEALARRDRRVRVFRFARNFGFQRSILTGYRLARGDAAVQIDCDLQDPPDLIPEFLRLWEDGYRVVYGVRRSRPDAAHMRFLRRAFYRLIDGLSPDDLPHDAGDFRLVDRRVIDLLQGYDDERPYLRGFIASLGFRQIGIAYDRGPRVHGETSFNMAQLVALALDGIASHSILPLRLASFAGLGTFAIAIAAIVAYVAMWFWRKDEMPAGFATLAVLMLISLAMNAIFLGILGEYVARIYRQVKPRPLTVVERYVDAAGPDGPSDPPRASRHVAGVILPANTSPAPRLGPQGDDGA